MMDSDTIRTVSVEEAKKVLHENGIIVTNEDAEAVLDALYVFAEICFEKCQ